MLRLVETPRARIGRMESALNAVSRRDAVPACGPRKTNATLEFEGPFEFGNGKLKGILAQPEEAHVLDLDIVDSLFVVKLPKKGDWVDEFRGRRRLETSGLQGRSGRLQKRKGDPSKRGRGRLEGEGRIQIGVEGGALGLGRRHNQVGVAHVLC